MWCDHSFTTSRFLAETWKSTSWTTCTFWPQFWLTFVPEDSHCYSEQRTEHIEQRNRRPQCPVIFTLGALRSFLNSCNIYNLCQKSVYRMQQVSFVLVTETKCWEAVVAQILCNWSREFIKNTLKVFIQKGNHKGCFFYFFYFMTKFSTACLTRDTLCLSSAKYQLKTFALMNTQDDSLWNLKNTAHVRAIQQKQQNKTGRLRLWLIPRCHPTKDHGAVKFWVIHVQDLPQSHPDEHHVIWR